MKSFRKWINESVVFATAKGSTYDFTNGQSRRHKVAHMGHEISDVGAKEISELTVFVRQEFAREVGMWGSSSAGKKRLVLSGNKVYLLSWNEQSGKHGLDKIHSDSTFTTEPTKGMCPLELWNRDATEWPWRKPDMKVFKSSHPGNQIVKIQNESVDLNDIRAMILRALGGNPDSHEAYNAPLTQFAEPGDLVRRLNSLKGLSDLIQNNPAAVSALQSAGETHLTVGQLSSILASPR